MQPSVFALARCAWRVGAEVPGAGEGGVRVQWERLVPRVPAAEAEQAGWHGQTSGPDEQHPLGLGLPSRRRPTAGEPVWKNRLFPPPKRN